MSLWEQVNSNLLNQQLNKYLKRYLFLFYLSYNIEKKETRKMKAMISSSIPVRLHQAKWQRDTEMDT